jgi:hypothetical protein
MRGLMGAIGIIQRDEVPRTGIDHRVSNRVRLEWGMASENPLFGFVQADPHTNIVLFSFIFFDEVYDMALCMRQLSRLRDFRCVTQNNVASSSARKDPFNILGNTLSPTSDEWEGMDEVHHAKAVRGLKANKSIMRKREAARSDPEQCKRQRVSPEEEAMRRDQRIYTNVLIARVKQLPEKLRDVDVLIARIKQLLEKRRAMDMLITWRKQLLEKRRAQFFPSYW